MTVSFSALVAYISSIQQIVFDVFHEGRFIGLVFASIAAPMAVASWLNSSVVGRFGLRRVGHTRALAFMLITAAPRRHRSCRAWKASACSSSFRD